MAHRPWTVTPHGPIEKHEENLWSVEGKIPGTPVTRRMVIVKRADGTLLFFHAIPLADPQLDELRAWGTPAVLVIGHDAHGIDAHAFAQKLGLKLYGPKKWSWAMKKKWPELAGDLEDLPADPGIRFEPADGTKKGEPIGIATAPNGHVSLLFTDAYQDHRAWWLRLFGFKGRPEATWLFKRYFVAEKPPLKAHFERLAALPGLHRILPCHGPTLEVGVGGALKTIAARDL